MSTGFKATITCVDLHALAPSFAGRDYDEAFLADLPASADPCGERGEFHSFVHDGPPLPSSPFPLREDARWFGRIASASVDLVPTAEQAVA